MCCFNRRMPRVINNNNLVVVPAVPVQSGGCGSAMVGGGTPCMPWNGSQNGSMMNNCVTMDNSALINSCSTVSNCSTMNNCIPSGTTPAGNLSGFTCNANFATTQCVTEPPLMCAPTVINHHNRVQHMVPCIKTNIHNVHNHHEWLPFEQSEVNEVVNYTHGSRPSDQQLCNSVR